MTTNEDHDGHCSEDCDWCGQSIAPDLEQLHAEGRQLVQDIHDRKDALTVKGELWHQGEDTPAPGTTYWDCPRCGQDPEDCYCEDDQPDEAPDCSDECTCREVSPPDDCTCTNYCPEDDNPCEHCCRIDTYAPCPVVGFGCGEACDDDEHCTPAQRAAAENTGDDELALPPALAVKEFKSTILPKAGGTRKVPTWHSADEARAIWSQRVSEYPVLTAVTRPERLRLVFVPGGRVTVAGDVVVDLAAAAQIKIEGMSNE